MFPVKTVHIDICVCDIYNSEEKSFVSQIMIAVTTFVRLNILRFSPVSPIHEFLGGAKFFMA